MNKTLLISLVILFCRFSLPAQNVLFTQYQYAPALINPASVGMSSDIQFYLNYRSQLRSMDNHIKTPAFTGILPVIDKSNNRRGGIGFTAISDQSGTYSYYRNSGAMVSLAYDFNIGRTSHVSFGMGGAWFQRSLTAGEFTTGSQYEQNMGYNPNLPTGETGDYFSISYFDYNAGAMYYATDPETSRNKYYVGVSAYHLNRANIDFGSDSRMPINFIGTAGIMLLNKPEFSIVPEALVLKNNTMHNLIGGVRFQYYAGAKGKAKFAEDIILSITPRYRVNQAASLAIELQKAFLTLGFAYEINTSKVASYTAHRGATEVMVALKIPVKKNKQPPVSEYSVGEARIFVTKTSAESTEYPEETGNYLFNLKEVVFFEFNESAIQDDAKEQLQQIADLLKGNKALKINIIGHSDNLGTEEANTRISEDRAESVAKFLELNGISRDRMTIVGKGSKEPVSSNRSESGRTQNRRVEFQIYK
ncbi:MAG: PorP/SprF family type IX secretion system membrane protein [Cytophagaceae bacterium]